MNITNPTTNPTTMNTEQQPEPLAAILAEMRDRADTVIDSRIITARNFVPQEAVEDWADRIEAAAKREYEEAKDYFAKLHDGPSMICTATNCAVRNIGLSFSAPGNAAAMRDVLNSIADIAEDAFGGPWRHREASQGHALSLIIDAAKNALTAPARNCDRFQTAEEAVAAFADHLRAWENAHGIHSEYPDHPVQVPAGAFAWLFDTAEGGVK